MVNNFKNAFWAICIFLLSYFFYKYNVDYFNILNKDFVVNFEFLKYFREGLNFTWKSNTWELLQKFFLIYWWYFTFYYLWWWDKVWKPILFWRWVWKLIKKLNPFNFNKSILKPEEKLVVLIMLVKFVYIPLMFTWFFTNLESLVNTISNIYIYLQYKQTNYPNDTFVNFYFRHIHWLLFNLFFFVDVAIFLFWYTVELDVLKNKIKSVEPTLLWWFVALACYPLLNNYTNIILGWHSSNLPNFVRYFWDKVIFYNLTMIFWFIFLMLIFVYVWASVALWFKASNLTNRWIVSTWPYKYIRHPAYISKNLARIVWALPVIISIFFQNQFDFKIFLTVLFSLIGWSLIYHLRSLTEERHLMQDPDYIQYSQKVKYMYIPKIF